MRLTGLSVLIILFISCTSRSANEEEAYGRNLAAWHEKRWQELRSEEGWLNLAGLYWLEEGMNSFGSDTLNHVVFPSEFPIRRAGYFYCYGS